MTHSGLMEQLWAFNAHQPARIALINMPFAKVDSPSIQCGLLKSILVESGHFAEVFYFNLDLANEIGGQEYAAISDGRHTNALLGEWLFSSAAFSYRDNESEYLAAVPALKGVCNRLGFERLCHLRKEVFPAMVQRWVEQVDWEAYHAVGFTSTFVQNNACFALARCIKEKFPHVATVFGGANFDAGMGREFLRKLPFMDYVVDGEGEEAIVELANRLSKGEPGIGIQGVSAKTADGIFDGGRANKMRSMDALPEPSYEEYFETLWRLDRKKILGSSTPLLLVETARGCWWGEKHHCTFCGLNASDMAFRSKSPERVLEELKSLANRYQTLDISVIDNIMNLKYIEKVCGPLAEMHCDYKIFWEVKSNLTPRQLKILADAGIGEVQPGIESLSTHVLALMRKGITMLKNVRFLKWANYFGINAGWNLLTGFPGENEEDYSRQQKLVLLLKHLQPPWGGSPIWLERYSPYFFDPSFPVKNIRPAVAYRFVYPESEIDLKEVAYFFDYEMEETIPVEQHQGLFALIKDWKASWEKTPRPFLRYRRGPDWIEVLDHREEPSRKYWLYGTEATVYEFCGETDRTATAALQNMREETGRGELEEVEAALEKCCDLGIMIEEDRHYLSLALPMNSNWFAGHETANSKSQTAGPVLPLIAA